MSTLSLDGVEDQTIPLPTLGLYASYALTPTWMLSGRVDYFDLQVGSYDGRLLDFDVNVAYHFTRNFALGLGYRYDSYKLEVTKSDFRGKFDYKFRGPQVFIHAGF
jgi:outer membrane scaffolding protein for murein synthesis (MipA/OmpV family)